MTVPFERTRAVNYTRDFLLELIDSSKTPRVPKIIRQRAYSLLRHYPSEFDMEVASSKDSTLAYDVFGKATDFFATSEK
jgi:hypothetical protein